jgi:predicted naringenin-chalcone synthase
MAWDLSSNGFLMTLSGYIPDLIEEDFEALTARALQQAGRTKEDITHWCIHPGGRRILDVIGKTLDLPPAALKPCYDTLSSYGNMSSATILFVLKEMMQGYRSSNGGSAFGAAFGPGLTMETFVLSPPAA